MPASSAAAARAGSTVGGDLALLLHGDARPPRSRRATARSASRDGLRPGVRPISDITVDSGHC